MKMYLVEQMLTGHVFGVYLAADEASAIDAMHDDAGAPKDERSAPGLRGQELPDVVTLSVAELAAYWGHGPSEWGVLGPEPSTDDEVKFTIVTDMVSHLPADEVLWKWEIEGLTQEGYHTATDIARLAHRLHRA